MYTVPPSTIGNCPRRISKVSSRVYASSALITAAGELSRRRRTTRPASARLATAASVIQRRPCTVTGSTTSGCFAFRQVGGHGAGGSADPPDRTNHPRRGRRRRRAIGTPTRGALVSRQPRERTEVSDIEIDEVVASLQRRIVERRLAGDYPVGLELHLVRVRGSAANGRPS